MAAVYIKMNDPPPTVGGDYEQKVREALCKKLSEEFLVIGGASFPTHQSYFYDYDLIVIGPDLCDIIEVKCIYGSVRIFEDWVEGGGDFRIARIFTILENKARVLAERLKSPPFSWRDAPRINSRVLIGPDAEITFDYKDHKNNRKVVSPKELIDYYKTLEREPNRKKNRPEDWARIKQAWASFSNKLSENQSNRHELGHFILKKRLPSQGVCPEYLAVDEPPCKIEVHLKEFPLDSFGDQKGSYLYLQEITREMQILRRLRHQYIHCVVGHFRTGCSLVQVSDWFDGSPLEKRWQEMTSLSLADKIGLMTKIAQGMAFCHSKGVFHRNINATNILANESFDDVRVTGFDFAKDLELSSTLTMTKMEGRDRKIIPPEELAKTNDLNYRLYDIYQTGLLFYRTLENGEWPFENTADYITGKSCVRELSCHKEEIGFKEIEDLILGMIQVEPENRPSTMLKIEGMLDNIIA